MNEAAARTFLVEGSSVREITGQGTGTSSGLDLSTALPVLAVAGSVAAIRYVAGGSWLVATLGGMVLTLVAGALFGCHVCGAPGTIGSVRCGVPCDQGVV